MNTTSDISPIKPTRYFDFVDGKISISMFGKPNNWDNRTISDADDLNIVNLKERFERIAAVCKAVGVHKVFCPNPTQFNAAVIQGKKLTKLIRTRDKSFTMCRGQNADGVILKEDDAYWISSADCPTIVAYSPLSETAVAAHAGRDSLVNRMFLQSGRRIGDRPADSVVESIVKCFSQKEIGNLHIAVIAGIEADLFQHPLEDAKYGVYNRQLKKYLQKTAPIAISESNNILRINIPALIKQQFLTLGASADFFEVTSCGTMAEKDKNKLLVWWSHRRGDNERNGTLIRLNK